MRISKKAVFLTILIVLLVSPGLIGVAIANLYWIGIAFLGYKLVTELISCWKKDKES